MNKKWIYQWHFYPLFDYLGSSLPIVHHTWERKTIESFSSIYIFVLAAKSGNGPADMGWNGQTKDVRKKEKHTPSASVEPLQQTKRWRILHVQLYVLIHLCVCIKCLAILPSCWPCTTTQRRAKKKEKLTFLRRGYTLFFRRRKSIINGCDSSSFLFVSGVVVVAFVVAWASECVGDASHAIYQIIP